MPYECPAVTARKEADKIDLVMKIASDNFDHWWEALFLLSLKDSDDLDEGEKFFNLWWGSLEEARDKHQRAYFRDDIYPLEPIHIGKCVRCKKRKKLFFARQCEPCDSAVTDWSWNP